MNIVEKNNLPKEQFTADYYKGIFTNNSIEIKRGKRKIYPVGSDQYVHGTYFIGADVINDSRNNFIDPDP